MRLRSWHVNVTFSGIGHALSHAFMLFYATVVLVLEKQWGLGYGELFALSIPGAIAFALTSLPAGWLADRWGADRMMKLYFFGLGAAAILTSLADDPISLALGLTLIGVFGGIYHPVGIPWLMRHSPNPGRALGVNGVFGGLGTAAAAVIAGGLAELYGWRAAFLAPGLFAILVGALFVLAGRLGLLSTAGAEPGRAHPSASRGERNRVYAVLAVTIICNGMIYLLTAYALPKVFEDRLFDFAGRSVAGVGALVSACYLVATFANILGGELADRFPLKYVYGGLLLLQAPFYVAALVLMHPALVGVVAIMISLNVATAPAETALLARYTPPERHGKVFGLMFMVTLGLGALASAAIPTLHRFAGNLDGVFALMAVLAVGAVVAVSRLPAPASAPVSKAQPALTGGAAE